MNPRRRFIEKGNSLYRQDLKRFSSSQETERRQPKINFFSIANEETFTINRSTESSPLAFLKQVCTHRAACIRFSQNNGDAPPLHRFFVCAEKQTVKAEAGTDVSQENTGAVCILPGHKTTMR